MRPSTDRAPQPHAATRRAYAANVRRFYVYRFLGELQFWAPIWVLYLQQERGFSLAQVTLLDVPFWIVIILAEVPTGAIADRWGRRLSLLLGAVAYAVAIFVLGAATNYWWILVSYAFWGVAMTLQSGADSAFLYESLAGLGREHEFQKVLGRSQALRVVAGLIGAIAGAPLAAATSLAFPIIASSFIALAAVPVVLSFTEPRHRDAGPHLPYFTVMREAARLTWRTPPLRAMLALRAVLMASGMASFIFFQPFLVEYHVPVAQFGLYGVPSRLLAIAGALLAYRMAARLGERRLYGALTAAFSGLLLAVASIPTIVVLAMFPLLNFLNAALQPLTSDYINRSSPAHLRATLASIGQMASSAMLIAVEPLMGVIADDASLRAAVLFAGAVAALSGGAAYLAWLATGHGGDRPHHT